MADATTCRMVLLGVCDSPCPEPSLSPFENKVGGYPDFFPSAFLSSPPLCRCCHSPLVLLLQVYCPLDGSAYHRLLHIFCCASNTACVSNAESWLVLRSQFKDHASDSTPSVELRKEHLSTDWCEGADDWGSDGDEINMQVSSKQLLQTEIQPECCLPQHVAATECTKPAGEQTQSTCSIDTAMVSENLYSRFLSLSVATPTKLESEYEGPFFPSFYVNVLEEPGDGETSFDSRARELLDQYRRETGDIGKDEAMKSKSRKGAAVHDIKKSKSKPRSAGHSKGQNSSEEYEKTVAKHGDVAFQKFHKQLLKCPQQILRYTWGGDPLMISSSLPLPLVGNASPACRHCGSCCSLEVQLMPPLVYLIQRSLSLRKEEHLVMPSGIDGRGYTGFSQPPLPRGVEFGTVLVFSCSSSCWSECGTEQFREEHVFVQPDPDEKLLDKYSVS